MKKLVVLITIISTVAFCLPLACSKKVDGRTDNLAPLQPAKTDADAGSWKTVLLAGPTEFSVAAPVATTTPEYIAQVNEIKTWQANITSEEKDIVKYWSAGAVLRWNEISARFGGQTQPAALSKRGWHLSISQCANNPLAYPLFPFSNPPYAARAYGYVSRSHL